MNADRVMIDGTALIKPVLEEFFGPLGMIDCRPYIDPHAEVYLRIDADRKLRRFFIKYFPAMIDEALERKDYTQLVIDLVHELLHPYNLDILRQAENVPWPDMYFGRKHKPGHPALRINRYSDWIEGSVTMAQLHVLLELLRTDRLGRLVCDLFGADALDDTSNDPEWSIAWFIAGMLNTAVRIKAIARPDLSELSLPFELPESLKDGISKAAEIQLSQADSGPLEYERTYHDPIFHCAHLISGGHMTVHELLFTPVPNQRIKRMLARTAA